MRAALSIVIPTLNAGANLAPTLGALGEGLQNGLIREVVISDAGSSDETLQIAESAGAITVTGAPGRGGQLIRGAERAAGEWLLFLHADTFLNEGWATCVLDHLKKHPDKAGFFKLRFRATGVWARLVAGWANVRSRLFGLPYGDQGLLMSRELYAQVGGYQNIPLMEDVAMAKSLRGKLRALDCIAWTSADRYQQQGWFKRGARNLSLLLRYKFGTSPEKLAALYTRKPSDEARSQP